MSTGPCHCWNSSLCAIGPSTASFNVRTKFRRSPMSATASVQFDPRDPAFVANPYPLFDLLRATAPVWKAPFGRWFLTRYDDCNLLLRDRRFGKDYADPDALTRRF